MKNLFIVLLVISVLSGCMPEAPSPELIIDPPKLHVAGRDTIATGSYLGLTIDGTARDTYTAVQSLQSAIGLSAHLHIAGNVTSDLIGLRERIPLYSYILLDQEKGTDSGVQITLEAGKVSAVYLNSGKQLTQWPAGEKESRSVRVGDEAAMIYDKLAAIRQKSSYQSSFERITLLTKDLHTSYDTAMARASLWYFNYKTSDRTMDEVRINLQNGKLAFIEVVHRESAHEI